ncbi:MAG: hypothetical protein N3G80_02775 [Candidatus Micrarchaeota archaeon]|nr:hypothetical protein [Candidatus Micrarchaeota archaeon]
MRGALIFLLFFSFVFAQPTQVCPVNPVPSYLDIRIDEKAGEISIFVYNISGDYEKSPIVNGLVYRVNLSGMQQNPPKSPTICYDVTDENGRILHTYDLNASGCIDYWYIFCPNDANTKECLNGSGLTNIPQKYNDTQPCRTARTPLNYVDYLPSHNEFYICNTPAVDLAPLCWPLMLIFSLLLGASFAIGRNPFSFFDFSVPRMGRGRQYSIRTQQKSFDILQYISGLDRLSEKTTGKSVTGSLSRGLNSIIFAVVGFLERTSQWLYFKFGGKTDLEKLYALKADIEEGKAKLAELKAQYSRLGEGKEKEAVKKQIQNLEKRIAELEGIAKRMEEKLKNTESNKMNNLSNKQVMENEKKTGEENQKGEESKGKTTLEDQKNKSTLASSQQTVLFGAPNIIELLYAAFRGLSEKEMEEAVATKNRFENFKKEMGIDEKSSWVQKLAVALLFGLKEQFNLSAFSSDQWAKSLANLFLQWLAFRERNKGRDSLEKFVGKLESILGRDSFLLAYYMSSPADLPTGLRIFSGAIEYGKAEVKKITTKGDEDKVILKGKIVEYEGKEWLLMSIGEEGGTKKVLINDKGERMEVIEEKVGTKKVLINDKGEIKDVSSGATLNEKGGGYLVFDAGDVKYTLYKGENNKEVAAFKKNAASYYSALATQLELKLSASLSEGEIRQKYEEKFLEMTGTKRKENQKLEDYFKECIEAVKDNKALAEELRGRLKEYYAEIMERTNAVEIAKATRTYADALEDSYRALKKGTANDINYAFFKERIARDILELAANDMQRTSEIIQEMNHRISEAQKMTAEERQSALNKLKTDYENKIKELTDIEKKTEETHEEYEEKCKNKLVEDGELAKLGALEKIIMERKLVEAVYSATDEDLKTLKRMDEWLVLLDANIRKRNEILQGFYVMASVANTVNLDIEILSRGYVNATDVRNAHIVLSDDVKPYLDAMFDKIGKIQLLSTYLISQSELGKDIKTAIDNAMGAFNEIFKQEEDKKKEEPIKQQTTDTQQPSHSKVEVASAFRIFQRTLKKGGLSSENLEIINNIVTAVCNTTNLQGAKIVITVPRENYGATFEWGFNTTLGQNMADEAVDKLRDKGVSLDALKGRLIGEGVGLNKIKVLKNSSEDYDELKLDKTFSKEGDATVILGRKGQTIGNITLEEGKVYIACYEGGKINVYENNGAKIQIKVDFFDVTGEQLLNTLDKDKNFFNQMKNEINSVDIVKSDGTKETINLGNISEAKFRDMLRGKLSEDEFKKMLRECKIYFNFKNIEDSEVRKKLYGDQYKIEATIIKQEEVQKQEPPPPPTEEPEVKLNKMDVFKVNALSLAKDATVLVDILSQYSKVNERYTQGINEALSQGLFGQIELKKGDNPISWDEFLNLNNKEKNSVLKENIDRLFVESLQNQSKILQRYVKNNAIPEEMKDEAEGLRKNIQDALVHYKETQKNSTFDPNSALRYLQEVSNLSEAIYRYPSSSSPIWKRKTEYEDLMLSKTHEWAGMVGFPYDFTDKMRYFVHGDVDRNEYEKEIKQRLSYLEEYVSSLPPSDSHKEAQKRVWETRPRSILFSLQENIGETYDPHLREPPPLPPPIGEHWDRDEWVKWREDMKRWRNGQ